MFYECFVGKLDRRIVLDKRPEYHRALAAWTQKDDVALAKDTGRQMSSRLLSLSPANVLLCLPPSTTALTTLQEGDVVDAVLIGLL